MIESAGPRPTGSGVWLARFHLNDFLQLNRNWLPPGLDRAEALRRFLHEGLQRLAPIAAGMGFEPDYYREVHPEYAAWTDEAAYRQWLFVDLERNWPGSAREHLGRLGLELDAYPAAFDWLGYSRHVGVDGNRWYALEHLLGGGAPDIGLPVSQDDAGFAAALGMAYRGRDDRSAVAAFELARRLGDASRGTAHQLADARYRRGEWAKALKLFAEAARLESDEVWTYVNGARAGIRLGAYRRAAALLQAGAARFCNAVEWRRAVHELVEARFAARTRRARVMYCDPRGRPRADRLIERAAGKAADLWDDLDPIGGPLPGPGAGKVLILANYDIPACVHYRVEQKLEQLQALGVPAEVHRLEQWSDLISALPGAAALIVFRLPAWPTVTRAMRTARRMGVPVYYDIDDLIFDAEEYPEAVATYGGLLDDAEYEAILFGTPLFRRALQEADFGLATTTSLAAAMQPLVRSGRVFVVPNGLDSRNAPFLALPAASASDDAVHIVYGSGTKAHNADWDLLAGPAVLAVMAEQPNVRLTAIGHLALSPEFDRHADRVRRVPHTGSMARFWDLLAEADVSLAVLKPSWATDAKSEIKWLEAAVTGTPSVVSATATYREVLVDGRDVLLADTPDAWVEALRRLCADEGLRRSIGSAARAKAVERYGLAVNARLLETALAAGARTEPPADRPVVLQVSTSDRPSVDGDRRAAESAIDLAAAAAGRPLELARLVLEVEPGAPIEVRVDACSPEPTLRISVPEHSGSDASTDPELHRRLAAMFEALGPRSVWLDAASPHDLAAARVCVALNIPYAVHVADVGAEAFEGPPSFWTPGAWALKEVLRGAEAVFAQADVAGRLRAAGVETSVVDPAGLAGWLDRSAIR